MRDCIIGDSQRMVVELNSLAALINLPGVSNTHKIKFKNIHLFSLL